MCKIKSEQLPLNHTLKTHYLKDWSGRAVQAVKVCEQTGSQV